MTDSTMKLGLHYDLPIEQYHSDTESVSKSGLDAIERSPWHYWALNLAPERPVIEPTAAMFAGTLAHCAILEPNEFDKRYVVGPDVDHRTKAWKDWLGTLPPGREAIGADQHAVAKAQAASFHAHPELALALSDGRAEVSARWVDEETGVLCRCRPDWVWPVGEDGVVIVDLKTCPDASPKGFARSVAQWRYHVQAAMYVDGFEAASGLSVHAFVFGAVENRYPFGAAAFTLFEQDIEFGRRVYRRNLALYARCKKTNTWPGYPDVVQEIGLPRWATYEGDE
jgi:hypothetical protein